MAAPSSLVLVPALGERVMRRIARVGPGAVGLAQAMAVLGDGGRLADAAAMAGLDEIAAAAAASRMRRIEVLAREDPFAFVHPLVRRSVYETLSVTERDAAHSAAANRLRAGGGSSEAVAAHLAAMRPGASAAVVVELRRAAFEAATRAAPEAATGWLSRALAEDAAEPPRAVLLHELGRMEALCREPAAVEHLREAYELAGEPGLRGRIARDLMDALLTAGRREAAATVISDALREVGDRDPGLAVELEAHRALIRAFDPGLVGAFDGDRERLRRLAEGDGRGARALAVVLAAIAAARGDDLDRVRPLVERGLAGGRLLAAPGAGRWASAALTALVVAEAEDRALEVVEELAAQAHRSGALIDVGIAIGFRGWMHARRGDLTAAEAELRTGLDLSVQHERPLLVAGTSWFLADVMLERASLDDVAARVESFELGPDLLATCSGATLLETRGRLRLARGDRKAAVRDLRACAATYSALGFGPAFSPWRSALALALATSAREETLMLVDEEVRLAAATGLARPHGAALRVAGVLKGNEGGLECLGQSVALLEDSPARLEHARSLVELGAALHRGGRRLEARDPLAAGLELAHRCGAERLAARADEELLAVGARPRRRTRTGVDALTARENRVARLAADGRSDSEVAQELFVSLKTVETDLTNACAKLGLAGPDARERLAAALEPAQP